MGQVPGRAKNLETVIGFCILAILCTIAVGLLLKQSRFEMTASDPKTSLDQQLQSTTKEANKGEIGLNRFLPEDFETLSAEESYNNESLYEKIDGKAPLYTESGFTKLSCQRFVSKKDSNDVTELFLYDMAVPENAFCVYSNQRRADSVIDPMFELAFGYKTANAFYFIRGKHYIELIGFTESSDLFKAMKETAQKIEEQLPFEKSEVLEQMKLFPAENLIAGSIKLYLTNAFGSEGLNRTFTAQYKMGEQTLTAFLSERKDTKDATDVAQGYRKFLTDNGVTAKKAVDKTLDGAVFDSAGAVEIVKAAGVFVIGIHEADDQNTAEKLAVELISKLEKEK
jgi:hypothetical protein